MSKITKIDHNISRNIYPSNLNTLPFGLSSNSAGYTWAGSAYNSSSGPNWINITLLENFENPVSTGDRLEYSNSNSSGSLYVADVIVVLLEDIDYHRTYIVIQGTESLPDSDEVYAITKAGNTFESCGKIDEKEGDNLLFTFCGEFKEGETYNYKYRYDDFFTSGTVTITNIQIPPLVGMDGSFFNIVSLSSVIPNGSIVYKETSGINSTWIQDRNLGNKALLP